MSKYQTEGNQFQKSLLGRKLAPMSGAAKKRSLQRVEEGEELPQSKMSGLKPMTSPKSREATRGKRTVQDSEQHFYTGKVTKESACIDALRSGFAQSYIDLFYLTHGNFPNLDVARSDISGLKDRLIEAEQFFQESEFSSAFQVYHSLGEGFESSKHFEAAIYFYNRCVEIAQKNSLHIEEATAYQGLGSCAFKTKQVAEAIDKFERGAYIAEQHNLRHSLIKISRSLTKVYSIQADKLEDEGRFSEALQSHMKCLESARNSEDIVSEGNASYRIGILHYQAGELEKALENFNSYLELSRAADHIKGVTTALAQIAKTHQEMGNLPKAIQILEQLHHEASEAGEHAAEAEASMHLGLLYQQQGQSKNAVEFLDKNFGLVKKLQFRSQVDAARVNLGMARAIRDFEDYTDLIGNDLDQLILWKTKRTREKF